MSRGEGSLPAGVPAPAIRREIPFLVGTAGIMLLLFGYYAYTWRSFFGFATAIDTCVGLFCDFVSFYFPMGGAIFRTALPVAGYVYSPFNAILLSVFPPLGLAASITVWGVLQALAIAAYIFLFRRLVPAGLPVQLLFVTLVLSSFPILHNVAWGQVGIFTTVAILAVLSLYEQRHLVAAAAALAFAVSFKFFPLIFLAPFAARRDTRFLMLAVLACGACLLLIPGVVLGYGDTLRFYAALFDSYRDMTWVVGNYNSQHFPHVALRLAKAAEHDWSPYLPLLRAISYGIAAANLGLVFLVQKRRLLHADLLSFHVLFLTIPFVMNTSWPVDLAYLPFTQSLVAWRVLRRPEAPGASDTGVSPGANGSPSRTHRARKAVTILLLLLSITVSNAVFFNRVGDRFRYGFLGFQFWANLLLLAATYVLLIPSSQERMTSEAAAQQVAEADPAGRGEVGTCLARRVGTQSR